MAPRYGGLSWLADQAGARMLRKNWGEAGECQQLAQELFTILTKLRDLDPGPVSVPTPDGPVNITDINLEDIDWTFLEDVLPPSPPQQPGPDPTFTTRVRMRWERSTLPCRVDSQDGNTGSVYNVTLFPYGDMTNLTASDEPGQTNTGDIANASSFTAKALQLQIDSDEVIPASTWCLAAFMQQIRITESLRDGAVVGTSVETMQEYAYIQVPVWL